MHSHSSSTLRLVLILRDYALKGHALKKRFVDRLVQLHVIGRLDSRGRIVEIDVIHGVRRIETKQILLVDRRGRKKTPFGCLIWICWKRRFQTLFA